MPLLDLSQFTDADARDRVKAAFDRTRFGSDNWRVLGATLAVADRYSFSSIKTYPRPDHPLAERRRPLEFLVVGILVSLRTTLENEQRAMDAVLEAFADAEQLYAADAAEIEKLIAPAGMASTKARRIVAALDYIRTEFKEGLSSLSDLETLDARAAILRVPGFGPKAADCLLTIGLGHASMVVDTNVFQVVEPLLGLGNGSTSNFSVRPRVERVKAKCDDAIGDDAVLCQVVHTLLLSYGKEVMKRGHAPTRCLVRTYCRTCDNDDLNLLNSHLQA